jgi:predicted acyl esterase
LAFPGGVFHESLVVGWMNMILRPEFINNITEHELNGPWWNNLTITKDKISSLKAPQVHWGGWYDIFLQTQIDTFETVQNYADPSIRGSFLFLFFIFSSS